MERVIGFAWIPHSEDPDTVRALYEDTVAKLGADASDVRVAAHLGATVRQLRDWRKQGYIPERKAPRSRS